MLHNYMEYVTLLKNVTITRNILSLMYIWCNRYFYIEYVLLYVILNDNISCMTNKVEVSL